MCISIFLCSLSFSASALITDEIDIETGSLVANVVEKDFETNIIEKKVYYEDESGSTNVDVIDSWEDESDNDSIALSESMANIVNPIADLASIIGDSDDRRLVSNTNAYPYSAIVHLEIFFGFNVYRGTGFLIADNIVVTAAHCLYDEELGWATNVTVRPGRNGALLPFGVATSKTCAVSTEYYETGDSNYDWGAISIHHSIINNPGSFSLRIVDTVSSPINARISGYPAYVGSSSTSTKKQYEATGTVNALNDYRFYYTIDTSGGQSGAPILNENNEVIGIHTSGSTYYNIGVRITPQVSYYLNEFMVSHD